jgi:hypothetical protein
MTLNDAWQPPVERVRRGMQVVDSAGEHVGRVEYLQMGDPGAATERGNELKPPGIFGTAAMAIAGDEREPDVPEPLRGLLLRTGFVKIDRPGLLDVDRYVRADRIADVSDDVVRLSVRAKDLPEER